MADREVKKVISLSSRAARLLREDVDLAERLAAARGEVPFDPPESILLLCLLAGSRVPELRDAALATLRKTGEEDFELFLAEQDLHPRILDLIARLHADNPVLAEMILWHSAALEATRDYLNLRQNRVSFRIENELIEAVASGVDGSSSVDEPDEADVEHVEVTGTEEYRTAYKAAQHMTIGQKIKMAFSGDKEWRSLLIKDTIKPVCCAVLKNPRITEMEILTIARSVVQYDDIIRLICANREWVKKYPIRKALVYNHRTPLQVALKLMATLGEKDLAFLAKSKNVSSVITGQARKLTMSKPH